MNKSSFLLVSFLILGMIFTGCSVLNNSGVIPTSEPDSGPSLIKALEVYPDEFPLFADKDILVGGVLVWNDDDNLCVRYELNQDTLAEGWLITETHLAVAADKDGIPAKKNGKPITKEFPYGDDNLGEVPSYQECILFTGFGVECGDTLVIAAHAVIEKPRSKKKKKTVRETAWGAEEQGEIRFVDKGKGKWETYFKYTSECLQPTAITVCKDDPEADYDTIQEAIDAAVDGDTIIVCPGTYYEHIEFDGKNITVQSSNPSSPSIVAATVIDGGGSDSVVRFVNFDTSTLVGFTIQNGNAEFGGGIYVYFESSPTITGNTITNNEGYYAGGIDIQYSSPTITGNTITNNEGFTAGGIRIYYSNSPTITGNTITNNDAQYGGGISIFYSCATVIGNTIISNTATSRAGGIYITGFASCSPTIENNTITGNTAAVYGGGICLSGGLDTTNPIIIGNTITGNIAGYRGGGIFANLNRNILPADNRPTGWGIGRENIPIGDPLVPVEGVTYTIADNKFLGNEHGTPFGTPLDYTEGAHVYFDE